jgi:hypothetical protein
MSAASSLRLPVYMRGSQVACSGSDDTQEESKSEELSVRLLSLGGRAERVGYSILRCIREARLHAAGVEDATYRCEQVRWCPRCGRRAAIKKRRAHERKFSSIREAGWTVEHVTLTSCAEEIGAGRRLFISSFGRLRRRACWRQIFDGGVGQIEVEPSAGLWNVHAHVACWRHPSTAIDVDEIVGAWCRILGEEGKAGSLTIDSVGRGSAPGAFRSARLLLQQGAEERAARQNGRRATAARSGAARGPAERPLRQDASMTGVAHV